MDERLEEACIRELEEETGIRVLQMTQFRTFDAIDRDPRHRTISVVHYTLLNHQPETKAGDDAKKAAWFFLDELPSLAFDHTDVIQKFLDSGLEKIR